MKKEFEEWSTEKIKIKHDEWLKYVKNKHNKKRQKELGNMEIKNVPSLIPFLYII